jgi:hypothetical protein
MLSSDTLPRWMPALGAAIPLIILFIAVLSIPLTAAQEMRCRRRRLVVGRQ